MGFFSKRSSSSAESSSSIAIRPTSAATAQRIKNILDLREVEAMPTHALQAFRLASDPKARTQDFVDVIQSDDALGARVIRVANSVYFSRGTPATDIDKAVANIGLDELRCLLSASMLRSLLQSRHPVREQIWANSIGTAVGTKILSSLISGCSSGEAFLAGLVHDVGKLIMIRKMASRYEQVIKLVASGERTFVEAEEMVYETNHVEVGKWIAESWKFPPLALRAIFCHHDAWAEEPERRGSGTPIGLLVRAADTISHSLGIGHSRAMAGFRRRAQDELQVVFQQLSLGTDEGMEIIKKFEIQFEEEMGLYKEDS